MINTDQIARSLGRGRGAKVVINVLTGHQYAMTGGLVDRIVNSEPVGRTDLADPATGDPAFMWGVNGFEASERWIML
jgi:hypothetical protein